MATTRPGYLRYPTIHGERLAFVAEDDLWTVGTCGGIARRLTASLGPASRPRLSPDGRWIAFSCREEGHDEVYVIDASGGEPRRVTFLGADSWVVGWTRAGEIVFSSPHGQPFVRWRALFAIAPPGGTLANPIGDPALPRALNLGPALTYAEADSGARVLGRHAADLSYWKRYRGGRVGALWIAAPGSEEFVPIARTGGNVVAPSWLGDRLHFASDHEGVGNLYSCTPDGSLLARVSDHATFCVRYPASDGERLVYQAGGDLWVYDPLAGPPRALEIDLASPRAQRKRRFVDAARHLEDYSLHPDGHALAVFARGKPYSFAHWEGAVRTHGAAQGVRYRLARHLAGGKHLVMTSDESGEERLSVYPLEPGAETPELLPEVDIGRPHELVPSPTAPVVALANHRYELLVIDLPTRVVRRVTHSPHARIEHLAWSPCGGWLAYSIATTPQTASIGLWCCATGTATLATPARHRDRSPSWDPDGRYLLFLSYRVFDPVYDSHFFELSFPRGARPFAMCLRADVPSPFVPAPRSPAAKPPGEGKSDREKSPERPKDKTPAPGASPEAPPTPTVTAIDLAGLERRVVAFPVREGRYTRVAALRGKALLEMLPIEGSLGRNWQNRTPTATASLDVYDYERAERETLVGAMSSFALTPDAKVLAVRVANRLRVLKAGDKPDKGDKKPGEAATATRQSGWVDTKRLRLEVDPPREWRQMLREAWRLMRDQFWSTELSRVDWTAVLAQYEPLVDRVATRGEFSDLVWEMQGELGTSHAYEVGGDYRAVPRYAQGFLGCELTLDPDSGAYRIERILEGDPWASHATSPLNRPGLGVAPGHYLLEIGGRRVGAGAASPHELLVHTADTEVELTIAPTAAGPARRIAIKALASEQPARYRDWVLANRRAVHAATDGRAGYVHIPDMGPHGYAEFHRAIASELDRPALVVDVRANGGGHVSSLILEKLARRRIGWDVARWGRPSPYPVESFAGPMVALTDENAGSDGDIFSHGFKLYGLGPLIGTRTWGGVIGIMPRHTLVDGSITTQPEFAFWFTDVGWGVENHGTDPDIEVAIAPQDHAAGRDPQLDRAIAEIQARLAASAPEFPDFADRPDRSRPPLPPR